jgi:hypothetical protein
MRQHRGRGGVLLGGRERAPKKISPGTIAQRIRMADFFHISRKYKDPKMGFPKSGTKDDWLWRRLNMHEDKYGGGWNPLPEVCEGFTTSLPAGTLVCALEDYQPKDGAPMFKSKCPKTGNWFVW